jgi:hypothetical protein
MVVICETVEAGHSIEPEWYPKFPHEYVDDGHTSLGLILCDIIGSKGEREI